MKMQTHPPRPLTKIEKALVTAIAEQTNNFANAASIAVCGCGRMHLALAVEPMDDEPDREKIRHDTPYVPAFELMGSYYVAGCHCNELNTAANIVWSARHSVAKFFRNFTTTLAEAYNDGRRVEETLPRELVQARINEE